jgi:hypothetical protein
MNDANKSSVQLFEWLWQNVVYNFGEGTGLEMKSAKGISIQLFSWLRETNFELFSEQWLYETWRLIQEFDSLFMWILGERSQKTSNYKITLRNG